MKGDVFAGEILTKKDELTGVTVKKMTHNFGYSNHPYFTQQLIDKDNEFMIFVSDYSGARQLYTLDLKTGKKVQLTDDADNDNVHNGCLDIKNNIVYYMDGQFLKSVRLDNLQIDTHLEIPAGFSVSILSITNDGRYLAFSYIEKIDTITQSGVLYSGMRETLFRRPDSIIIRYDTIEKKSHVVYGDNNWLSHVNISPVDPNTIMFCHEGPWHMVQRLWIAKVETDEIYPIVEQKLNYERVGHEVFTASGRIAAQYTIRYNLETDLLRDALFGDVFVDPDGKNQEIYFYKYTRPAHIQINYAENMSVGDRAQIRAGSTDHGQYISLNKYANHRIDTALLCKHGTSWKSQSSHPHPFFTRDDKNVIFASEIDNVGAIYMVEANWDKTLKSE